MAIASNRSQSQKWNNLSTQRGHLGDLEMMCLICGGFHMTQDHWQFLQTMPQDPVDLIDDLVNMGIYKSESLNLADTLNRAELRKALFLKAAGKGNPKREKLCNELSKAAGGFDQAFAAAFGPKSAEFFGDAAKISASTRRQFLRNVAIGAALVTLSNCGRNGNQQATSDQETEESVDVSNLEKTNLKIGFIPITCATPIIMSKPLGFYERYGFSAEVVKMPSWAAVRDSAIAGELDAYHMLAPMPIAMTLGLGSSSFPVKLASIENINGQAITVASKYQGQINGPEDFRGFSIGVPFEFSMHNLLLRYYLATGGIDPDKDVQIQVVPPPDSVARLAVEDIDAYLMPDPFNQRAVAEGAGFIHMLTKDLWPGHPCCAFAASDEWIDSNPNTFRALNKAIIDGAGYASNPENRREIAEAISARRYLNQPVEVVEAVLTGQFDDGRGNQRDVPDRIDFDPYPWKSFSHWISSQLVRWDFLPEEKANYGEIADDIFLTDLARELAQEVGQDAPEEIFRTENLMFDEFNPDEASNYVKRQIDEYGV
ncbi:ABC transporter substrate-binding protein [Dactylococcopsis salina]|uniref:ABC-type nitrate/sulfonate/bicarbonate transport system, periplasmic component n=2 Tax=Dactylococcopsis salina TaxID=292566 RepID=K9YTS6_DACS8|nr:ABC-type nitrate/sulfonate/bicarbonate transport system, periplasmic component [Dactylococcopsis salina PCC 8305]